MTRKLPQETSQKITYWKFINKTPAQFHGQKVLHSHTANDLGELGRVPKCIWQPEL